jgi:hypothetical protein
MPGPRKPTLPLPLDSTDRKRPSLEATDWRMYCDRLQDADAPEEEWQRAGRIASSLAADVKLVIVNPCPAPNLASTQYGNHWLRVGRRWFIGAEGTLIEGNLLMWWRRDWIVAGFARYPSSDPDRVEVKLTALNYGTPWDMPHPRWPKVQATKVRSFAALIKRFFDAHAHAEMPQEYL